MDRNMRNTTDYPTFKQMARKKPNEYRMLGLQKFWLTNDIYLRFGSSDPPVSAPISVLNHQCDVVHVSRNVLWNNPQDTATAHAFCINNQDWYAGWYDVETTQWGAYCGELEEPTSQRSHLCSFGFLGFHVHVPQDPRDPIPWNGLRSFRPGSLHANPGGSGFHLALDEPTLSCPPDSVLDSITARYERRARRPREIRIYREAGRRLNYVAALEAVYNLWERCLLPYYHPMAPLPREFWPSKYDILFLPRHTKFIPFGPSKEGEAVVKGRRKRFRIHQLTFVVWVQMFDLNYDERQNFQEAKVRVCQHVRIPTPYASSLLNVPSAHKVPLKGGMTNACSQQ